MNTTLLKNKDKFLSNRIKENKNFASWLRSTYIIMTALIWWLLLYYIWILNVNATLWFSIRKLEKEQTSLMIEKDLLDVKIAELESLETILNEEDIKNMENVVEPEYIVIRDDIQYVYNWD